MTVYTRLGTLDMSPSDANVSELAATRMMARNAKVLEHERRDYPAALAVARASASPCAHRIARLQRRCVTVGGDVIP